jgi:hypothetical protein
MAIFELLEVAAKLLFVIWAVGFAWLFVMLIKR